MLRHRPPAGAVFTYLSTLVGAPSVPGADSYPQRYPLSFVAQLPRAAITVKTPAADGNIAVFANRWRLIDDDTLPDFFAYVSDHVDDARAMLATPVADRAHPLRLVARAGQLAGNALMGWRVIVSSEPPAPSLAIRRGLRRARSQPEGVVFGLASPPRREAATLRNDSDSRVWTDRWRRPFDVTVELLGGRTFSAQAEKAVMLASTRRGDPRRLTVQLPPADADATERAIVDYAVTWGFPTDAADGWRRGVERRRDSSDRDYSTHVFTPDDVGAVHLEFQVADHVREGDLIVTALFSWGDKTPRSLG